MKCGPEDFTHCGGVSVVPTCSVWQKINSKQDKVCWKKGAQHTVFPDGAHEIVGRVLQKRHDILVQRVHVLEQPLVAAVVHAAGVVNQTEAGTISEVWPLELWMARVLDQQLVHQRLVGRLREPALFIHQRKNSHWLTTKSHNKHDTYRCQRKAHSKLIQWIWYAVEHCRKNS